MDLLDKFARHPAINISTNSLEAKSAEKHNQQSSRNFRRALSGLAQVLLHAHVLAPAYCSQVAESPGEDFEDTNISCFISNLCIGTKLAHLLVPAPSVESRTTAVRLSAPFASDPRFVSDSDWINAPDALDVACCIFPALLGYYCSISEIVVDEGCGNYNCDCGSQEDMGGYVMIFKIVNEAVKRGDPVALGVMIQAAERNPSVNAKRVDEMAVKVLQTTEAGFPFPMHLFPKSALVRWANATKSNLPDKFIPSVYRTLLQTLKSMARYLKLCHEWRLSETHSSRSTELRAFQSRPSRPNSKQAMATCGEIRDRCLKAVIAMELEAKPGAKDVLDGFLLATPSSDVIFGIRDAVGEAAFNKDYKNFLTAGLEASQDLGPKLSCLFALELWDDFAKALRQIPGTNKKFSLMASPPDHERSLRYCQRTLPKHLNEIGTTFAKVRNDFEEHLCFQLLCRV